MLWSARPQLVCINQCEDNVIKNCMRKNNWLFIFLWFDIYVCQLLHIPFNFILEFIVRVVIKINKFLVGAYHMIKTRKFLSIKKTQKFLSTRVRWWLPKDIASFACEVRWGIYIKWMFLCWVMRQRVIALMDRHIELKTITRMKFFLKKKLHEWNWNKYC